MKTYTMTDWRRDGSINIAVGQLVDNDVVRELINSVPPITYRTGVVQVGEAYDHDSKGQPLYMTFFAVQGGWEYKGLKREL